MSIKTEKIYGFTLVELAIVIVIIGLLVGGVLQGKELIKQAQIRTLIKTVESYKIAIYGFQSKYNCLPGDCTNAYTFFGNACDSNPANCNGNGDNFIFNNNTNNDNESLRMWQHLSLGNLIKGGYKGFSLNDADVVSGLVIPRLGLKDAYLNNLARDNFVDGSLTAGLSSASIGANQNYFMVGKRRTNISLLTSPYLPFIEPEDAYNIDLKLDDGKPFSGTIFLWNDGGGWLSGWVTNCTNNTSSTATYLVNYSSEACHLNFGW